MNFFITLAMVGLVGVGMVYGEDAPKKREVTVISDIGENGRNEVELLKKWRILGRSKVIDRYQFSDLLKQYSDLMAAGRITSPDWVWMEIARQTELFSLAYGIWDSHPELQSQTSALQLKSMSDALYAMIKEHQIPNYKERPCVNLSVAIYGEPSQAWKDYVQKNSDNGRENITQRTIKDSIVELDSRTQSLDREIAKRGFDTNKTDSASSPTPPMNLFRTLAMVGLVGVGMIDSGMCKEAKDSTSVTNPVVSSEWKMDGWTSTQKPEEADFTVIVSYSVPGVVKDRDTFFFKKAWVEVRKYADGSTSEDGTISSTGLGKSRCGGGSGCSGAANVDTTDEGLRIFLHLHWSGKKTGKLKREFLLPWSELQKTVQDDECEIHVTVNYDKPSSTPQ